MVWRKELKFKLFRVKFIFNLNVVFTLSFIKMVFSRVRFSPGFQFVFCVSKVKVALPSFHFSFPIISFHSVYAIL
jgi:hypothetical protein